MKQHILATLLLSVTCVIAYGPPAKQKSGVKTTSFTQTTEERREVGSAHDIDQGASISSGAIINPHHDASVEILSTDNRDLKGPFWWQGPNSPFKPGTSSISSASSFATSGGSSTSGGTSGVTVGCTSINGAPANCQYGTLPKVVVEQPLCGPAGCGGSNQVTTVKKTVVTTYGGSQGGQTEIPIPCSVEHGYRCIPSNLCINDEFSDSGLAIINPQITEQICNGLVQSCCRYVEQSVYKVVTDTKVVSQAEEDLGLINSSPISPNNPFLGGGGTTTTEEKVVVISSGGANPSIIPSADSLASNSYGINTQTNQFGVVAPVSTSGGQFSTSNTQFSTSSFSESGKSGVSYNQIPVSTTQKPIGNNFHASSVEVFNVGKPTSPRYSTPSPAILIPVEVTPFPGCPAAMKCVPEIYCDADGYMRDTPVSVPRYLQEHKVPLTDCSNPETGEIGKCCRDPNYKDPWPDMPFGQLMAMKDVQCVVGSQCLHAYQCNPSDKVMPITGCRVPLDGGSGVCCRRGTTSNGQQIFVTGNTGSQTGTHQTVQTTYQENSYTGSQQQPINKKPFASNPFLNKVTQTTTTTTYQQQQQHQQQQKQQQLLLQQQKEREQQQLLLQQQKEIEQQQLLLQQQKEIEQQQLLLQQQKEREQQQLLLQQQKEREQQQLLLQQQKEIEQQQILLQQQKELQKQKEREQQQLLLQQQKEIEQQQIILQQQKEVQKQKEIQQQLLLQQQQELYEKQQQQLIQNQNQRPSYGSTPTLGQTSQTTTTTTTFQQSNVGVSKPFVTAPVPKPQVFPPPFPGNQGHQTSNFEKEETIITSGQTQNQYQPFVSPSTPIPVLAPSGSITTQEEYNQVVVSGSNQQNLNQQNVAPVVAPGGNYGSVTTIIEEKKEDIIEPIIPGSACGVRRVGPGSSNTALTKECEFAEFPWQALVVTQENAVCGGALITDNYVLTGAHCVEGFKPSDIVVRLGEWKVRWGNEPLSVKEFKVSAIVLNPEFQSGTLFNDAALLLLSRRADPEKHVDTICVPPAGSSFVGQQCIATGWGRDALLGFEPSPLYRVNMPVLDKNSCQQRLRDSNLGKYFILHQSFICAGGDQRSGDTCKLDAGGPLVCQGPGGHYQLAGIRSWDLGCNYVGAPSVYTDINAISIWINSVLSRPIEQVVAESTAQTLEQIKVEQSSSSSFTQGGAAGYGR